MIDYETFCKIRDCHDRQGLTIVQTARALALDPRTVAKWLARSRFERPRPTPRSSRTTDFGQLYHYTESGLDNVYLKGGVTHHKTVYGKGVSIDDTEGLHKVIGRWLIQLPKPLNGAELRFLRLEMEITQERLAALVGTTEQTVGLWERQRKKAMPGAADRLLRALYSEYIGSDGSVRRMVGRLAKLDQIRQPKAYIGETRKGWQVETQLRRSGVQAA